MRIEFIIIPKSQFAYDRTKDDDANSADFVMELPMPPRVGEWVIDTAGGRGADGTRYIVREVIYLFNYLYDGSGYLDCAICEVSKWTSPC